MAHLVEDKPQEDYLSLDILDLFLRSQDAFPVIKLDGFLTAINSSPSMILPSQWLQLCKVQNIAFENTKQATIVMRDIMSLYNHINSTLRNKTYKPILYIPKKNYEDLPSEEKIQEEIKHNLKLWATGYWDGIYKTWPSFKQYLASDTEVQSSLGIIYCLTRSKQELLEECKALDMTIEDYYRVIIGCLPNAAMEIYDFWLNKREKCSSKFSAQIVEEGHIGRNDRCPCGSGKKYKKCCLH